MIVLRVKSGRIFGTSRNWRSLMSLTTTTLLEAKQIVTETITRIFEYKIKPNRAFIAAAENVLLQCQRLYNACLEQKISHYQYAGKSISWVEQCQQVTDLREADPAHKAIPRNIQTDVVKRLDKAYQAFFRRVRAGETAGFPRFRGKDRYNSFEYAVDQRHSAALVGTKLRVAGVGTTRVKVTRLPEGAVKIIRIIRKASGWFAQLVCVMPKPEALPKTGQSVGVDVGLEKFATLSNGEQIDNPRFSKKAQDVIANAQRVLSRKRKGSNSRAKAKKTVAKAHAKIANQRKDFAFKLANKLVKRFDVIAVEKLNIRGMVKGDLAFSISDAGWNLFTQVLRFKAECAGREYVEVNPKHTSQDCSGCGARQKLTLRDRVYSCPSCGLVLNRDVNAALNIKGRGASLLAEKLARRAVSAGRNENQDDSSLRLSLT